MIVANKWLELLLPFGTEKLSGSLVELLQKMHLKCFTWQRVKYAVKGIRGQPLIIWAGENVKINASAILAAHALWC